MNDFTKVELHKIKVLIDLYDINMTDDTLKLIKKKAQFIIDNYCEHDYIEKNVYICHKCNAEVK